MRAKPRRVVHYLTEGGADPFDDWLDGIADARTRHRIIVRVERAELGNLGDFHSVGDRVCEMVLDFGPGYRVYFGLDGDDLILLGGGDKGSQAADIRLAKERWEDYHA